MSYSEAQKNATAKYKKNNYKRIPFDVPIERYDAIKNHATKTGESVNGFINRAIDTQINIDEEKGDG